MAKVEHSAEWNRAVSSTWALSISDFLCGAAVAAACGNFTGIHNFNASVNLAEARKGRYVGPEEQSSSRLELEQTVTVLSCRRKR